MYRYAHYGACIVALRYLEAGGSRVGAVVRLLQVNLNKKRKNAQLDEWKENGSAEYICHRQCV